MRIDIMTLFPEAVAASLKISILGRAEKKGILDLRCVQIRDYTENKQQQVDDYPYGGGWGERIRAKIERRVRKVEYASLPAKAVTAAMYPAYHRARRTAPFHVNDTCIGCAACANRCPSRAIEMKDGHPTWVKERCCFCMSCVRCGAIEYGTKLTGKARYKHPTFDGFDLLT